MNPTTEESPLLRRLGAMRATATLMKMRRYLFDPYPPKLALSTGYALAWVMFENEADRRDATAMLRAAYSDGDIVDLPFEYVRCLDTTFTTFRQRGFVYIDLRSIAQPVPQVR